MLKAFSKVAGFVGYVIQYGCFAHCTFEYVGDFVTCSGPSMEPTLYTNNILVTERLGKRFSCFDRGDIIVARNPIEPQTLVCKRIVGLPGDKIFVKPRINFNPFDNAKSVVTTEVDSIDNKDQSTKQLESLSDLNSLLQDAIDDVGDKAKHLNNQDMSMRTFRGKVVLVPKGHVWLEGDNADNSTDSRSYGPVPIGLIQSRIVCRIWPVDEVKLF